VRIQTTTWTRMECIFLPSAPPRGKTVPNSPSLPALGVQRAPAAACSGSETFRTVNRCIRYADRPLQLSTDAMFGNAEAFAAIPTMLERSVASVLGMLSSRLMYCRAQVVPTWSPRWVTAPFGSCTAGAPLATTRGIGTAGHRSLRRQQRLPRYSCAS
jgi:hypothetical protein